MTTELLPLSSITDDELLGRAYLGSNRDPIVAELATRFEHALRELAAHTEPVANMVLRLEQRRQSVGRTPPTDRRIYGSDA